MLLKTADEAGDIKALEALLHRSDVDARQRRAIQTRSGRSGSARRPSRRRVPARLRPAREQALGGIHDLRIDVEGQVAQIDHLVISRMLEVFVARASRTRAASKSTITGSGRPFATGVPSGSPPPSSRTGGISRSWSRSSSSATSSCRGGSSRSSRPTGTSSWCPRAA